MEICTSYKKINNKMLALGILNCIDLEFTIRLHSGSGIRITIPSLLIKLQASLLATGQRSIRPSRLPLLPSLCFYSGASDHWVHSPVACQAGTRLARLGRRSFLPSFSVDVLLTADPPSPSVRGVESLTSPRSSGTACPQAGARGNDCLSTSTSSHVANSSGRSLH